METQSILPYILLTAAIGGTLGHAWLINPDATLIAAIGLVMGIAAIYLIARCPT